MRDLNPPRRQHKGVAYPYDSALATTLERRRAMSKAIDEWVEPGFDLKERIEHSDGLVIELAGPTEIGHYYLNDVRLPSLIISNIAKGTLTDSDGQTDAHDKLLNRILDVRHLDLPDNSVDVIIATHLPVIDEEGFDFSNFSDEANAEYSRRRLIAEQAIEDLAVSGNIDEASVKQSLRLTAAKEIHRCLKPGGMYLADGTRAEKAALQKLGYTLVAAVNGSPDNEPPYYYMVLRKK